MEVRAEMVARMWKIEKTVGTDVVAGEVLAILESMKMEIPVVAPVGGVVQEVHKEESDSVSEGDLLFSIAPSPQGSAGTPS